jgi:hypothetical protein
MTEIITDEAINEIISGARLSVKSVLSETDPRFKEILSAVEYLVSEILKFAVSKQLGNDKELSHDDFYSRLEPQLRVLQSLTDKEFEEIFDSSKQEFKHSLELK